MNATTTPAPLTRDDALAELRRLNPRAADSEIRIYADKLIEYAIACTNITKNGPIVIHPRTGTPIDNPFVKVRDSAAKTLRAIRLHTGELWQRI